MASEQAADEVRRGDRFAFGANWSGFLTLLDDTRIGEAEASLRDRLGDVKDLRFLDAGSGSGLFSLAACNLGAQVVSFDYDPRSVACTRELRRQYHPNSQRWAVHEASVLDAKFLRSLGRFDIVYSWGVLHHTGDMWTALQNVADLPDSGGTLFISLYNDQGRASHQWFQVKRHYNSAHPLKRRLILATVDGYFRSKSGAAMLYRKARHRPTPETNRGRGMDRRHDLIDWVGGWPFEVAKPDEVFDFLRNRGYRLDGLKTCAGGLGCNEFVFRRE